VADYPDCAGRVAWAAFDGLTVGRGYAACRVSRNGP
jgi:hypothetical protein